MGTQDPLVHIEAATLAGGEKNQDRYAYGDGWAFVLDGASSFSETPPVHDGGWYAERLKYELSGRLQSQHPGPTAGLVAEAICGASERHDPHLQGACPSSTIAMARWGQGLLELFVLGDSTVQWVDDTGTHELTDSRIDHIAQNFRDAYRRRLANGSGFDLEHRRILARMQKEQLCMRNRPDGYWIAGDDPNSAHHGLVESFSAKGVQVLLYTDGLSDVTEPEDRKSSLFTTPDLSAYLDALSIRECNDPSGREYPRSKIHDDKTVVRLKFSN